MCMCMCVCVCVWGGVGGGGGVITGASVLVGGGGFEKICKIRAALHASTMGKPEKNHLIIKKNCSVLKKQ